MGNVKLLNLTKHTYIETMFLHAYKAANMFSLFVFLKQADLTIMHEGGICVHKSISMTTFVIA